MSTKGKAEAIDVTPEMILEAEYSIYKGKNKWEPLSYAKWITAKHVQLQDSHREVVELLKHIKNNFSWDELSPTLNRINDALKKSKNL